MKKISFFILLFTIVNYLSLTAQVSEGGIPPSFKETNLLRSNAPIPTYRTVVDFDVKILLKQDSIVEENKGIPRFAKTILVENLGIDKSGQWTTLNDSTQIWRQSIKANGAQGLLLSYNDFYIPEGGKLFIYDKDQTQILGAFTHNTNPEGGLFATDIIIGDELILEYVSSNISDEAPRVDIEDVGYVYNDKSLKATGIGFHSSQWCMINVNCTEGQNWQKQKQGVALMKVKQANGYWEYCTGSLINNTLEDKKPYFLTASHCFRVNSAIPEQTIFNFNYESESCTTPDIEPESNSQVGAEVLVQNLLSGGGDGALLLIKNGIPDSWNPFFNGWDIRNEPAARGVVIHHPNGDIKKITTYKETIGTTQFQGSGELGALNAFWSVKYDGKSVTQGGSSGSPLFNQYGLIIGTLTGGATSCSSPYARDQYGKLWYNWDKNPRTDGKEHDMSKYLDPIKSGVRVLRGIGIIDGVTTKTDISLVPDTPTGIEDEGKWESQLKDFVLFPNPVQDQLNINTNSIMKDIKIYDLSGKVVYQVNNHNASTLSVSLSDLQKGVYMIVVNSESGKTYKDKFVKN